MITGSYMVSESQHRGQHQQLTDGVIRWPNMSSPEVLDSGFRGTGGSLTMFEHVETGGIQGAMSKDSK